MPTPTETASELIALPQADASVPSVGFIQAISQFFETDPSDLLQEMGYYDRHAESSSGAARE